MDIENLTDDDEQVLVTELIRNEGGVWVVTSEASRYVFDLDRMTVIRNPGENASANINDVARPIDKIVTCIVGESGYWTMRPEAILKFDIEHYWQLSTPIIRIERIPKEKSEPNIERRLDAS